MMDARLRNAQRTWGLHPSSWLVPSPTAPSFFAGLFGTNESMKNDRLQEVFGPITQEMRDRFWSEPGQSPYEDAGGAMLRRYEAFLGLPVELLPTYAEVIDGLGAQL